MDFHKQRTSNRNIQCTLLVLLASKMQDIDDYKIFKTRDCANVIAFLEKTPLSSDDKNNAEYGRCVLVVDDDRKMFVSFPVTAEDIQSKFDYSRTKKRSLFELYITD